MPPRSAETLGGRAEEIADTLDQRVSMFEERVVNRLDGVVEAIDEKGQAVLGSLGGRIGEIRSIFDTQGLSLVSSLGERGEAIGRDVAAITDVTLRTLRNAAVRSSKPSGPERHVALLSAGAHLGTHFVLHAIHRGDARRGR